MFTGLIEEIGLIKSIRQTGDGINIEVSSSTVIEAARNGDSIAIDGACQTVTNLGNAAFTVYASRITCETTTLGSFKAGRRVNLERALQAGSRFGGHIVQGHIDGRGYIASIKKDTDGIEIHIDSDEKIMKYIAGKGSVAVDGISLTVVSLTGTGFVLYLVPETLGKTTIPEWKAGNEVNIEVDILAKYVERMLAHDNNHKSDNSIMKNKLLEEGFIT